MVLNRRLLRAMAPTTGREATRQAELARLTAEDDLEKVKALFEAFFASVPHDWHRKNDLANYEGYWAALVYSHFAAAGLDVRVEEATARGRLDMAVLGPGCVHLYGSTGGRPGCSRARLRGQVLLGCRSDRHGVRPGGAQHRRVRVRDRLKPGGGRIRISARTAEPPPRKVAVSIFRFRPAGERGHRRLHVFPHGLQVESGARDSRRTPTRHRADKK